MQFLSLNKAVPTLLIGVFLIFPLFSIRKQEAPQLIIASLLVSNCAFLGRDELQSLNSLVSDLAANDVLSQPLDVLGGHSQLPIELHPYLINFDGGLARAQRLQEGGVLLLDLLLQL
jgi:hypothetical protein